MATKFGFAIGINFGLFGQHGVASCPSSLTYWTDVLVDGWPQTLRMLSTRGTLHSLRMCIGRLLDRQYRIRKMAAATSTCTVQSAANYGGGRQPRAGAADFEGISIYCATELRLKDEPGGYTRLTTCFGDANVQAQIPPDGPITDLDGNVIMDSDSNLCRVRGAALYDHCAAQPDCPPDDRCDREYCIQRPASRRSRERRLNTAAYDLIASARDLLGTTVREPFRGLSSAEPFWHRASSTRRKCDATSRCR